MPRDMENKKRLDAIRAQATPSISVKVRKDSGILEAVDIARKEMALTRSDYMREALREALIRDGYLTPDQPESEETT